MSMIRSGAYVIGLLIMASILGGVLGAVADIFLGDLIVGTPLGPQSRASPMAWTVIAFGVMYSANEVRD